jgi:HlyD family secretion protein
MIGIVILIAIIALVVLFAIPSTRARLTGMFGSEEKENTSRYVLHRASKGPFRIEITENGTVDSLRNATLSNSVEGNTTIISLVPEGSRVKAPVVSELTGVVELVDTESESSQTVRVRTEDGQEKLYEVTMGEFTEMLVEDRQRIQKGDYIAGDVVCELDSSTMVEKEKTQQISVTEARANLEKAEKNLEIQRTTNESLLSKAKLAEMLARLDLQSYTAERGEYRQLVDTLQGQIKQFQEQLAMAQEEYENVRDQARRGYTNLNNLEAARIKVSQNKIDLEVKKGELGVLEEFTKKRTISELEQVAEESVRDIARAKLEGEAAMAQMQADYDARKLTLQVEEEKLDRLLKQIKASRLVAPQAGEVVYASQNSRRSEPVVIEEGATVRERQAIINLPDLDNMKIDARIHESRIGRIAVGQPVEIQVDAVAAITYHGILQTVSSVPVPGSWPNTDLKEYEAAIAITDDKDLVRQLKPGMTAEIRIIVDDRDEDVLQVPVQSVLALANKYFTYVFDGKKAERREIVVGEANDVFIEIIDGVAEGEQVVMNPRTHFSREINDLETRLSAELEASRPRVKTPPLPSGGPGAPGPGGPGAAGGPGAGPQAGKPAAGDRPGAPATADAAAKPGPPNGGGGGFDPKALFERLDTNKDGAITKDESDMRGNFDKIDANGDGKITSEELTAPRT